MKQYYYISIRLKCKLKKNILMNINNFDNEYLYKKKNILFFNKIQVEKN